MPKLNGLKLNLELRKEGHLIKDRIVFYAGRACGVFHQYPQKINVPFLIKPVPLKKLKEYVSAYCDQI